MALLWWPVQGPPALRPGSRFTEFADLGYVRLMLAKRRPAIPAWLALLLFLAIPEFATTRRRLIRLSTRCSAMTQSQLLTQTRFGRTECAQRPPCSRVPHQPFNTADRQLQTQCQTLAPQLATGHHAMGDGITHTGPRIFDAYVRHHYASTGLRPPHGQDASMR